MELNKLTEQSEHTGDTMKYDVSVVKAFTNEKVPTLGNPAGVVITEEMLSQPEMQEIGIAAQQPITAFLSPRQNNHTDYELRYYDLGGRECHICGHATIAATAQLLRMHPDLDGKDLTFHLNPDLFEGQNKTLTTHIRGKEISIDLFPSVLRYESDPSLHKKISEVLGINVADIDTVAFSVNIRDYVVALKDPDVLLKMKPDFIAMKKMAEKGPYSHEGLMVSCPAPSGKGCDLYVRVFLPITGVNEDIACGSGNCSIVPMWHDKGLNRDSCYYKSVFPFPEGQEGFVGGVQFIEYSTEQQRITIISQATFDRIQPVYINVANRAVKPTARGEHALS